MAGDTFVPAGWPMAKKKANFGPRGGNYRSWSRGWVVRGNKELGLGLVKAPGAAVDFW